MTAAASSVQEHYWSPSLLLRPSRALGEASNPEWLVVAADAKRGTAAVLLVDWNGSNSEVEESNMVRNKGKAAAVHETGKCTESVPQESGLVIPQKVAVPKAKLTANSN